MGASERNRSLSDDAVVGLRMHVVVLDRLGVGVEVEVLDWEIGRAGLVGPALTSGRELAVKLALDAAVARVAPEALRRLVSKGRLSTSVVGTGRDGMIAQG
jgi:hypothetical protein